MYVAGQFSVASEDLNNINVPWTTNLAVWNRVTERWSAVGGGLVNNVGYGSEIHALAYYDGVLYVGGRFDTAYAFGEYESTSYLAAWDGSSWQSYSNLGNMVLAIAVNENGLYAGGVISQYNDGSEAAGHIARWNGFAWQVVSSGTDDEVLALYTDGVYLYLGGQFSQFAGQDYAYVAGWVEP